jgi:acyl carrier protein
MTELEDKIITIISELIGAEKSRISLDSNGDDLGADSLDKVSFVMKLEEELGVQIGDQDAEGLSTIRDAVEFVRNWQLQYPD